MRRWTRNSKYRPAGWLHFDEVAVKLGCSIASARQRAFRGPLASWYVLGEPMVHEKDLASYLRSRGA